MDENMNVEVTDVNEVEDNEVYEIEESSNGGETKAVVIGAAAAAVVTAGIYGGYKLVGKAKAAWKRHKLKKEAESEIAQAKAFESYEEAVNEIHEEQETE